MDFRIPEVRDLALEWFGSSASATRKAGAVEFLASTEGWGPYPGGSKVVPPGSPGTPAQAEARLALLDEIAAICPEPLIQQKLKAARASLVQQTQSSSK